MPTDGEIRMLLANTFLVGRGMKIKPDVSKKPHILTVIAKRRDSDQWFTWLANRANEAMQHFQKTFLANFSVSPVGNLRSGNASWRQKASSLSIRNITCRFASLSQSLDPNSQANMEELKEQAQKVGQQSRIPIPQTDLPLIGEVKSLALKQLLCGIIAGGVASTAVTPFEIIRTRTIAGDGGKSAVEVLKTVIKHEGWQSIMQGSLLISMFQSSLQKGIQFFVYEAVKRRAEDNMEKDPKLLPHLPRSVPISTLAGASAGLAALLLTYPFQTITDRVVLRPNEYKSLTGTLVKIVQKEGFAELFRGITPAIVSVVPSAATSFYTYDTLKKKYLEKNDKKDFEVLLSLLAGAAAGGLSATLTYPLEVARKQISMSALPCGTVGVGGPLDYSNTLQALVGIIEKEGFRGLYRGLNMQVLEMVPLTALSFMTYEIAKRAFLAQAEERCDEVKDHPSS
ncbi:hypothetical protein O6H91_09G035100 [Diphasiastrum complanatum]|uniref:Uncharacterized protein n=1 Tax=Diphasiastrum complanatum TaxID=34168 RepID=A0ACC2CN13_DIPCM|nr:hypothetical protein O6H91_Y408400 [Diphasiastrum complanatum]KAJ7543379.1 hypothetical protein O6H91_09G035100 [Diphasiastrum complanatum]